MPDTWVYWTGTTSSLCSLNRQKQSQDGKQTLCCQGAWPKSQSRAVCRVPWLPRDYWASQTYGNCDAACCVAAWERWQWPSICEHISGYPLNVLSLELHGEDDAQLFDSRFKGVSAYQRSRLGNSHDASEKWDSKNMQERHLAILILLTSFLRYLVGKIFFPSSISQNSSLV